MNLRETKNVIEILEERHIMLLRDFEKSGDLDDLVSASEVNREMLHLKMKYNIARRKEQRLFNAVNAVRSAA